MKKVKTLTDALTALDARATEGNKLIANGKLTADFLLGFAELEQVYATLKMGEVYDELKAKAQPRQEAVLLLEYEVLKHKVIKDKETNKITAIELDKKVRQITPEGFAKHCEDKDTNWKGSFEELRQMWLYRLMAESGADTKSESTFIQNLAKADAAGKNPVSNNKMQDAMQKAFDDYLGADSGFKCNNRDFAFIAACFAGKGSEKLSIKTASTSVFNRLLMTPMHRAMTNGRYAVKFTVAKGKKETAVMLEKKTVTKNVAKKAA